MTPNISLESLGSLESLTEKSVQAVRKFRPSKMLKNAVVY